MEIGFYGAAGDGGNGAGGKWFSVPAPEKPFFTCPVPTVPRLSLRKLISLVSSSIWNCGNQSL